VGENVSHEQELKDLAQKRNVADRVTFLRNVSDAQKPELITQSTAVLYTPANEHFGIVPIEALSLGTPVIACNSGGPMETVAVDGCWLCDQTPEDFSRAMLAAISDVDRSQALKQHTQTFGFGPFTKQWIELIGTL
jgi:glycosyltransferase involved in cell wall biosynthesis